MNPSNYFYINNQKFNYKLEFNNSRVNHLWKQNAPLIEYCETLGITIPHYCYHKNLSISGNCRMCLVELKNSPKPIVSCAMTAKSCLNNNYIYTNSPLVKKARENILEFLLLNHPLDCPICDQGGECDLQDQSLYFGVSKNRFYNFKRVVTDKNIGPIVKTVMTRCIHCTRCVRFSAEVAGTEELGMFGRGLESEIGTYVKKTFQSELSGNVIDLCPVGALTSKPYPFLSRNWELKTINSIDFSDGFGSNLLISIKNNKIVKINSSYEYSKKTNIWISDKTRFSFDGMFSPGRLNGFIKFGNDNYYNKSSWKTLVKEIITTLYFQDHLNNHFFNNYKLIIVFSYNVSLEVLNLLNLFSKKYKFIELRVFEGQNLDNTFESEFLIDQSYDKKLDYSDLCLIIGMNSRYENSNFNLSLRKNSIKKNFKTFLLGSSKDLTFPSINLGMNMKNLYEIVEGNNPFNIDFAESKNSFIAINSSTMYRKDYKGIKNLLNFLRYNLPKYNKNKISINTINSSINEAGSNYLNKFSPLNEKDFSTNFGIYFLNTQPNSNNLNRLIKLKILNYTTKKKKWPNFCLNQNLGYESVNSNDMLKHFNVYNYINLPNSNFFESTSTYLTTEGSFKNNVKFLTAESQKREDWKIIRKVFYNLKSVNFLQFNNINYVSYSKSNFNLFKRFITFLYYSFPIMNKKTNYSFNKNCKNKPFKNTAINLLKNKIFLTKFSIKLSDFYIGGSDPYSKYSHTMINCSKSLRLNKNSFSHLI